MRPSPDGIEYLLARRTLEDGEVTTVYAVRHPARETRLRVVFFPRTEHLDVWCRANEVEEAVVGGFFLRDPYRPLGDVWIGGRQVRHEPVATPFGARRGSVVVDPGGAVRVLERGAEPVEPSGDLVQAGPLLVAGRAVVFDSDGDPEGFSAGAGQFDSDITAERHPRCALGVNDEELLAVCCDGRTVDADLPERPVGIAQEEAGDDRLGVALLGTPVVQARRRQEARNPQPRRGARVAHEVDRRVAAVACAQSEQLVLDAVRHPPGRFPGREAEH